MVTKLTLPSKENAVQEKVNEIIDNLGGGYSAGTGIDISNNAISVTSPTITNNATGNNIAIGNNSSATGTNSTAVGYYAKATGDYSVALGDNARTLANDTIQIGYGGNNDSNTCKVGFLINGNTQKNYDLLNGTTGLIPDERISSNIARASDIPAPVTETTVSGWGFTKNTGTVTSVNSVSPVNGNVTLSIPTVTDTYSATSSDGMSGKAVASAISGKANDSDVVKLKGNQTINGTKTFSNAIKAKRGFDVINSGVTKGTNPSSTAYWGLFRANDKNDETETWPSTRLGIGEVSLDTNGKTNLMLGVYKNEADSTTNSSINVGYDLTTGAYAKAPNPSASNSTSISDNYMATTCWVNDPAKSTNVVHRTGDETIGGTKTFSSDIVGNVTGSAAKLTTKRTINGVEFDGSANIADYGTCTTAAATQTKDVTLAGFVLGEGAHVRVKFTNYQNYNDVPKLNVNGTGAKEIKSIGTTNAGRYYWQAGEVVDFTYDGTYWLMDNGGIASTTYYGRTKLQTSATSTSTTLALTPGTLNSLVQNMIEPYTVYSTSATYAVGDRVRYNYQAWECNTAITTAELWTAAHWEALPDLQTQIDSISSSSDTVGTVKAFAGSTAPTGWLKCDGSAISRTTYSALFAVIGTTYGSGNGSTTFNVPNVKLQGGTISVLGNGKTLGMTDGTNKFGVIGQVYLDGKISINTGAYNKNAGATGVATGTGPTGGVGYGVVTSGESGLTLGSTQTVNAIIKY